jgi:hypothetical protein
MRSILTNINKFNTQINDHFQKDTTKKLVKQQEELLRNLSKVRQQMEMEEEEIGLTKDYYSGSREEKFGHTFDKADKLRKEREQRRVSRSLCLKIISMLEKYERLKFINSSLIEILHS